MVNWYANCQWPSSALQPCDESVLGLGQVPDRRFVSTRVGRQSPSGYEDSQDTKSANNSIGNFTSAGEKRFLPVRRGFGALGQTLSLTWRADGSKPTGYDDATDHRGGFALTLPRVSPAQKLLLAHVAVNPSQGMLHLAKDSGMLAKYGFSAEVVLIPGTPRTIQALIAGDLDYVAAGAPASLRARAQGADVTILSTLANFSSQRIFVRPDSKLTSVQDLKGKIIGVTQYGSGGDTFLRAALRKIGMKESEVTILQMGGTPGVAQGLESRRIEVGVLGDSGMLLVFRGIAKPMKGASAREMGFRGTDAPLTTTDRKSKPTAARWCASCKLISKRFIIFKPISRRRRGC